MGSTASLAHASSSQWATCHALPSPTRHPFTCHGASGSAATTVHAVAISAHHLDPCLRIRELVRWQTARGFLSEWEGEKWTANETVDLHLVLPHGVTRHDITRVHMLFCTHPAEQAAAAQRVPAGNAVQETRAPARATPTTANMAKSRTPQYSKPVNDDPTKSFVSATVQGLLEPRFPRLIVSVAYTRVLWVGVGVGYFCTAFHT